MQILGKRSKILLIAVAIVMLLALGVSFALWDTSVVKATSGNLSNYANAKVGDVVEFGRYYQTGNKVSDAEDAEYEKTPIEWIVVDKDERSGQLTLMSKYILAAGSYFGNYYKNKADAWGHHYNTNNMQVAGNPYNQAYVESTVRAFLNNLERRDLGGDSYTTEEGYMTSITSSVVTEKLYASVGFSNRRYSFTNDFVRPIGNFEYRERPATRGFYDEAFWDDEKAMILPKAISGYTGHHWPNNLHEPSKMSYVEGVVDKVWLASASELNNMDVNDEYTNPNDEASATVFEYFKNYTEHKNPLTNSYNKTIGEALKTIRTTFVSNNSKAMNYSIPLYKYQSTEINEDIHDLNNSIDFYWTRSPMSYYYNRVRYVDSSGSFNSFVSNYSHLGVRPCITLKY